MICFRFELIKQCGANAADMIKRMKMSNLEVPQDYMKSLKVALACFKHMTVFDPKTRKLTPLNPWPAVPEVTKADMQFLNNISIDALEQEQRHQCGDYYDDSIARKVADGILMPKTKLPYADLAAPKPETSVAAKAKKSNPFYNAHEAYARKTNRRRKI